MSNKKWREDNKEKAAAYTRKENNRRRRKILVHYGGDPPKCTCCKETLYEFLALDHTNGGGLQHRKSLGIKGGTAFYRWIIRENFPTGFRVLCHNCNSSYGLYGYCPHDRISV